MPRKKKPQGKPLTKDEIVDILMGVRIGPNNARFSRDLAEDFAEEHEGEDIDTLVESIRRYISCSD